MEIKVDSGDLVVIDGVEYLISIERDELNMDKIIATSIIDVAKKIQINFFQNTFKNNHQ